MSSINHTTKYSTMFNEQITAQCAKSGAIGAMVTLLVARSIYRKDMIQTNQRIFYKDGFKASFLFSISNLPKVGIQIPLYHLLKSVTTISSDKTHQNIWNDMACSSAAGLLAAPVYNPFEHIALQYHKNQQNDSVKKIFQTLYQKKRIQQGLCPTSIRDLKFSCLYNTFAPVLSKKLSKKMPELNLSESQREFIAILIASSLVGAVGGILQTPSDVLRAKRQIASLQSEIAVSYFQSAKALGWKGLFASWQVKALIGARVVPILALADRYYINPSSSKVA